MKKFLSILLLFIISIVFYQCDRSVSTTEQEKPVSPANTNTITYRFDMRNLSRKADSCEPTSCTEVSINYPVFAAGPVLHENLNALVQEKVKMTLADFIMAAYGDESIGELMKLFTNSYEEFKENFPDSKAPWTIQIDVVVNYTNRNFISLAITTDSYTGGAHPIQSIDYLNVAADGKPINDLDFYFNNVEKVTDLANRKLRNQLNLASNENYSDKGIMFDDDIFSIPSTIGFTNAGAVVYWNSGDLAAYSEGPIVLTLSFAQLKGFYKHKTL